MLGVALLECRLFGGDTVVRIHVHIMYVYMTLKVCIHAHVHIHVYVLERRLDFEDS